VTILAIQVNCGASSGPDAAAAVELADLCRVEAGRQLRLVDDDCWTLNSVVRYFHTR